MNGFRGVPVFQAEGLAVTVAPDSSYTPLFLSKQDLDIAVEYAKNDKDGKQTRLDVAQAKADRAKQEIVAADKMVGVVFVTSLQHICCC